MMTWAILAPLGGIAALLCVAIWLYVRMAGQPDSPDRWISCLEEDLSRKYQPMVRLLNEEDFVFLRTQAGYEPKMEKRLRTTRARIYARYLRAIRKDFSRLCTAGRVLAVHATTDRTDLVDELARLQAIFRIRLLQAYWTLFLYRGGFQPRHTANIFEALAGLQRQVRLLAAPIPNFA